MILKQEVESNLHPKWQIIIAEALVEMINIEMEIGNPLQSSIVETHSEHIVLKLKQLVKNNKIHHDLIAIYYVYKDKKDSSSKIQKIRISENGNFIDKWVHDFFPERLDLI